jgi:hypothetical protein
VTRSVTASARGYRHTREDVRYQTPRVF